MFKYKNKAAGISVLCFVFISAITCTLYTENVKSKINAVKTAIVDNGLSVANVSEYRRAVATNLLDKINSNPEDFLNHIRQSYAEQPAPGYLYDIGPFFINNDHCINITMKGGDYCKEIMTAFKVNNHHQIGIIKFSGKGYAYYQHPVGYRMSLIFVVDPERYLSLMKLQTEKRQDLFISLYDINDNEKRIAGDDFLISDSIFPMSASTRALSYVPDMMFIVAYKKSKYFAICFILIAISAVITWLIYHYHVKLLSKILYRGQLEKEAILSNQFHEIRGENIFFSPGEINMIRDIYDFGAYDSLTRASVRRIFDSDINDLSENFGFLCLFDVDKFKVINDKFGHLFGDEVLIKLVGLIKEQLPCDKGDVYRFGGDEFAIIYRDNDLNALLHMLSHIVRFRMGGLNCSCSIGIASTEECGNNIERLKVMADERLYKSKKNGRAQITWQ